MANIMVVDDDPHIRELLTLYLQRDGLAVIEAEDGLAAMDALEQAKVDLLIVDIMMPRMDGFDLCREVRQMGDVPILMLTAKGETPQKVKGLRLGADDYVVKPVDPAELVARVRALLRRYRIATEQTVSVGELRLDKRAHQALFRGNDIVLPMKEFDLLFELASNPLRTLSREQLIESVWGYDFAGDERTVDVHVKRLRDKFPEESSSFRIRTVRGLGYRLEVTS